MSLEEFSEATMQQMQAQPMPVQATYTMADRPWWQTFWAPVLVIVLCGAAGAGLTIWRDAPVTSAEVRELKVEVVAIKAKDVSQDQSIQQIDKAVLLQGGEVRTNRDQIENLRKSMEKIESYYGATLREIQALNVSFAEVRGGLQQQGKIEKNAKRGNE
jgi:hypothetical protein